MENQINSKTDSTDSAEQTVPEAPNEQQATSENNQINADVSTPKQPETKAPDVTGTETIADANRHRQVRCRLESFRKDFLLT